MERGVGGRGGGSMAVKFQGYKVIREQRSFSLSFSFFTPTFEQIPNMDVICLIVDQASLQCVWC